MENSKKTIIIYYILVFIITYGQSFILMIDESLSLLINFLITLIVLIMIFLVIFILSKLVLEGWKPKIIGGNKISFMKSFMWVSASLIPATLIILISSYVIGIEEVMMWGSIGIEPPYPLWLPLFGVFYWLMSGVIAISFWQAFPYECLEHYPKKYVIPMISILFILLYNQPLLTGGFYPGDIFWLAIVFVLIYHKFRNSLSLIVGYIFLFEAPVLWCFGATFGGLIFLIILYIRALWCISSAIILIVLYFKKKAKEKQSVNLES